MVGSPVVLGTLQKDQPPQTAGQGDFRQGNQTDGVLVVRLSVTQDAWESGAVAQWLAYMPPSDGNAVARRTKLGVDATVLFRQADRARAGAERPNRADEQPPAQTSAEAKPADGREIGKASAADKVAEDKKVAEDLALEKSPEDAAARQQSADKRVAGRPIADSQVAVLQVEATPTDMYALLGKLNAQARAKQSVVSLSIAPPPHDTAYQTWAALNYTSGVEQGRAKNAQDEESAQLGQRLLDLRSPQPGGGNSAGGGGFGGGTPYFSKSKEASGSTPSLAPKGKATKSRPDNAAGAQPSKDRIGDNVTTANAAEKKGGKDSEKALDLNELRDAKPRPENIPTDGAKNAAKRAALAKDMPKNTQQMPGRGGATGRGGGLGSMSNQPVAGGAAAPGAGPSERSARSHMEAPKGKANDAPAGGGPATTYGYDPIDAPAPRIDKGMGLDAAGQPQASRYARDPSSSSSRPAPGDERAKREGVPPNQVTRLRAIFIVQVVPSAATAEAASGAKSSSPPPPAAAAPAKR
jgi:hypothetical protein